MDFAELFKIVVRRMYDMELTLADELDTMSFKARDPELRRAFMEHRIQTLEHVKRLDKVAELAGFDPHGEKSHPTHAFVKEANATIRNLYEGPVRDAALILFAQNAEHMEIAVYGTALALCKRMGLEGACSLLKKTLDEEKDTDAMLTKLAESGINQAAVKNETAAYIG